MINIKSELKEIQERFGNLVSDSDKKKNKGKEQGKVLKE